MQTIRSSAVSGIAIKMNIQRHADMIMNDLGLQPPARTIICVCKLHPWGCHGLAKDISRMPNGSLCLLTFFSDNNYLLECNPRPHYVLPFQATMCPDIMDGNARIHRTRDVN
ncbi:hypothetical protein TNCV_136411 [Trichonephila clavipes]|nr:hypothetical protein TNCV_136411 [Trichonephila clavipes]